MIPWTDKETSTVKKHRFSALDRRQIETLSSNQEDFELELIKKLLVSSDDSKDEIDAIVSLPNALLSPLIPKEFPQGTQNVLICADHKLSCLALESLEGLSSFTIHRDFSLAMYVFVLFFILNTSL